jgi:hypothetical protein
MIVFEEKMREIIGLMPCITDANNVKFEVRYDWGTIDVLNKFLLLKENKSKYPLIWLITGKDTEAYIEQKLTRKARFVIATRSNDVDKFNEFQYKTDFVNILIPVYENLITTLEKSGISRITDPTIDKELRPNYSFKDNGKGLIYNWNAIVVDISIEIDAKRCLNTNIKYGKRKKTC